MAQRTNTDGDVGTALDGPELNVAYILRLDVDTDPLFAWTGYGDLVFDGAAEVAEGLDFDFENGVYSAGGVSFSGLSNATGYSFTRSGEQGAIDSAGGVAWFGANVPAVNDRGYHVYQAMTNVVLRSSEFDNASWGKSNAVVTADQTTAPDGTVTADKVVDNATLGVHQLAQGISAAAADEPIVSLFVKRESGTVNVSIGAANGAINAGRIFDPDTGAELGQYARSPGNYTATHLSTTTWANGWSRHTVAVTNVTDTNAPAFAINLTQATAPIGNETYSGAGTGIYAWHAQVLKSAGGYLGFSDGGPLIRTAGATAALGASSLHATCPALADEDMLLFARFTVADLAGATRRVLNVSDGTSNNRITLSINTAGEVVCSIASAGVTIFNQTHISGTAGQEAAVVLRRLAGQWRFGLYSGGTISWDASGAVTAAVPAGLSTTSIGAFHDGGGQLNGIVHRVAITPGTFATDQEVVDAVEGNAPAGIQPATGDPALDGQTFSGITHLIADIGAVEDSHGGSNGLEIVLPGVDLLDEAMQQVVYDKRKWQFLPGRVWIVFLDDYGDVIGKPVRVRSGKMDQMKVAETDQGEGVVKCTVESQQAYAGEALNTRYSEQAEIDPTDNSQRYIWQLANMNPVVGKRTLLGEGGGRRRRPGSFGGLFGTRLGS